MTPCDVWGGFLLWHTGVDASGLGCWGIGQRFNVVQSTEHGELYLYHPCSSTARCLPRDMARCTGSSNARKSTPSISHSRLCSGLQPHVLSLSGSLDTHLLMVQSPLLESPCEESVRNLSFTCLDQCQPCLSNEKGGVCSLQTGVLLIRIPRGLQH